MFLTALPLLKGLLEGPQLPKTLGKILDAVLGGSSVRDAAEGIFARRLNAQEGRSGGRALAHAICEQVDEAMETKAAGVTVDQRIEVGTLLAKNAAVQLAEAAEILLKYPELQAAVVRAKEAGDAAALAQARTTRDAATTRVREALTDVGRVAAGDAPKDA
jgi:hypothetical protein